MTAPQAILFDMDGTLIEPLLDFPAIKREMGIDGRPILEAIAQMDEQRRREAEAILVRHECAAAESSTLVPGCRELLDWLEQRHIGVAVITRNSRASTRTIFQRHGLHFDVLVTREDGSFKPDPAGLAEACRCLRVGPAEAWMVGDGQYDVEAGLAAGTPTVWITHGQPSRPFAAQPWRTVRDLVQLTDLLRRCLD